MRESLYRVIEDTKDRPRLGKVYDMIMVAAILISLITLCIDAQWTEIVDKAAVCLFIIDYILRWITADFKYAQSKPAAAFIRYPFGIMAIIDLLSIIPSFGFFNQSLRILRTFRLFRTLKILKTLKMLKLFRAFRVFRYSRSVRLILNGIKEQKESLTIVGCLTVGYILISAFIIYHVEPATFTNFFDAIYWAVVSLTTVGYGDIYPVSIAGRIITMISSFFGIAIVALPASIITAGYMDSLREEQENTASSIPASPDSVPETQSIPSDNEEAET